MPPVFGPCVAVDDALEVLGGLERQTVSPSVMAKSETSGPSRNSSIDDAGSAAAAGVRERGVAVVGDDDALAGGEAVVLDDVGRAERVERRLDLVEASHTWARGRGNVGRGHDVLGERLGALQPGRLGEGPKTGMPARAHGVGDPGDERGLRADDDEVDAVRDGRARRRPSPSSRPPGSGSHRAIGVHARVAGGAR